MRQFNVTDRLIGTLDQALRVSFAPPPTDTQTPAAQQPEAELSDFERQDAAGLMRINHAGEVCAQALYEGQALTAGNPQVRDHLLQAAKEERRHLRWCHTRLTELDAGPSQLNLFWFLGSWTMGAFAGLLGDRWSLGFVVETERQVEAHLAHHLDRLPPDDLRSRLIVEQMMLEEARHGAEASDAGGRELPAPVRGLMAVTANVMKFLAYRF